MSPAFVESIRCHYCQKHRPRTRVHRLQSNQVICDHCLEWHFAALDMLGGSPPPGCQGCNHTWAELCAMTAGQQVRLYVVPKDSIYQLLCATCVRPYLPKRAELYKDTQFGNEALKL